MIQLTLSNNTEKKLKKVLSLQRNQENFFLKVISDQINELKKGIINIEKDLRGFENKYKMDTKAFYKKFKKGEINDESDFMIWSGIYEMLLRDKQKLQKLQ